MPKAGSEEGAERRMIPGIGLLRIETSSRGE